MNVDRLSKLPIQDEAGRTLSFGDLWAEQNVLVVFVRHFGCIFCRQQLIELREIIPEIVREGSKVVVIGNGTSNFIRGFKEAIDQPSLSVYCDPTLATYEAADLNRGHLATLDPRWAASGLKAFASGYRQGETQGDVFQLGGVLLFARGGELLFRQTSRFAGDHATPAEILAATKPIRSDDPPSRPWAS
jgi:hypothetical protein